MKEVTMCCTTCPSGCALKVMIDKENLAESGVELVACKTR